MAGGFGTAELRLREVIDTTDVAPGAQRHVEPMLLPLWSLRVPFCFGLCYGWYHEKYRMLNSFMIILHTECSHLSIWDTNFSLRRDLRDILQFLKDVPPYLTTCWSPEVRITAMHGKFIWECHLFLMVTPNSAEACKLRYGKLPQKHTHHLPSNLDTLFIISCGSPDIFPHLCSLWLEVRKYLHKGQGHILLKGEQMEIRMTRNESFPRLLESSSHAMLEWVCML